MWKIESNLRVLIAKKEVNENLNEKITFEKLEKELSISKDTLCSLKNNKSVSIKMSNLNRLCQYFNCTPGDILKLNKE